MLWTIQSMPAATLTERSFEDARLFSRKFNRRELPGVGSTD